MTAQKLGSPTDFVRGQIACEKGLPCPENETGWFERGYSAQYQLQEIKSNSEEVK